VNWSEQKAVVTGACGFIGSRLVETLARRHIHTKALVLYDARGNRGWLDELPLDLKPYVEILAGDVRDTEFVRHLISPGDVVFHLAALIGIPYSYHAPRSYVDTNITGTLNVLEACRTAEANRVLVISTSEVYGTALEVPIRETHPLQGQSPYSATKIAAEKLAESYYRSFELPAIIVRPFNTYGPRQSPRAVIPTILMQALAGRTELVLGDLETTRDFNFVDDTVSGLIRLAECEAAVGQVVNIGTGTDVSIRRVVDLVQQLTGRQVSVAVDPHRVRPPASEVRRLCADNTLLKKLTGWVPPPRLDEGLKQTMEWMQSRLGRYEAGRYYV